LKDTFSIFSVYLRYLYPYKVACIATFFLLVLVSAASLVPPYLLKFIIDIAFANKDMELLFTLLGLTFLAHITRLGINLYVDIKYTRISKQIVSSIRQDVFSRILQKPLTFFSDKKEGDVTFLIMNDIEKVQEALTLLLYRLLNNVVLTLGILVMLFLLDYKMALACITLVPVLVFSSRYFTPFMQKTFRNIQSIESEITNFVIERTKNIRVIKSFNAYNHERNNLKNLNSAYVEAHVSNVKSTSWNDHISSLIILTAPVLALGIGGYQVITGAFTIGALIAFTQYLTRVFTPSLKIVNSYAEILKATVSMRRISEFIALPDSPKVKLTISKIETIAFNKVDLTIKDKKIVTGINMRLITGMTYGLYGPSGSGKTTILNSICGFITPDKGKILINDSICLNEIANLNDHIGLIEKENQLFYGSLEDNIVYNNKPEIKTDFNRIIDVAGLKKIISQLPDKDQTILNSSGQNFSDGQKQRISIARALLKKPSVLIFDEATSTLDLKLEKEIINNIKIINPNCIIILISHRMRSLKELCDVLIEIKEGKVVPHNKSQEGLLS
jgi:ABC-type bacteriocin/lantibiotic exporter with double-glycine peptidase domain